MFCYNLTKWTIPYATQASSLVKTFPLRCSNIRGIFKAEIVLILLHLLSLQSAKIHWWENLHNHVLIQETIIKKPYVRVPLRYYILNFPQILPKEIVFAL